MFENLPASALDAADWGWSDYKPYVDDLEARKLTAKNVETFLADWTKLAFIIQELYSRFYVAVVQDTNDEAAEAQLNKFTEEIIPPAGLFDNNLTKKLLESGLEPEGFEIPLRNMKADIEAFCEENLPLIPEQQKLNMVYSKTISNQSVNWEGEEVTLTELANIALDQPRETREKAWRLGSKRVLEDREVINENWVNLLKLRLKIAKNADKENFRDLMWLEKYRFSYTPEDCKTFHDAIERVVVPAAARVYERRRKALGVDTFRPWDLSANPMRSTDTGVVPEDAEPINPFDDIETLEDTAQRIFDKVDPKLGGYFKTMRDEGLLDLPNRKGKGPGAFCTHFETMGKPFVFANATGTHEDVQTVFHELGHAFHAFEVAKLPYHQLHDTPMEFNEVASMAMELLTSPYITRAEGGFYDEKTAARARIEHLEGLLIFWPYMAVVDAFQHWIYENTDAAMNPANLDAKWTELWDRFMVGVDYSGLDDDKATGWHRKQHIHTVPFYYVEYGLAQLGAVQVWGNAIKDQAGAVESYLNALALGGSKTLPEIFATAGAKFAFDVDILTYAVGLIEGALDELTAIAES